MQLLLIKAIPQNINKNNYKKLFGVMNLDMWYLEGMEKDMFGELFMKNMIQGVLFLHLNQVKKVL